MGAAAIPIVMVGAAAATAFLTLSQANNQAQAEGAQGLYQKWIQDRNAAEAERQAKDRIAAGDLEASQIHSATNQLVGTQRAAYAAQGVDVSRGSAAIVQQQTKALGELDAITLRSNAIREAYGYKRQAMDYSMSGEVYKRAAENRSSNTLATGGIQALGGFLQGSMNGVGGMRGLGRS